MGNWPLKDVAVILISSFQTHIKDEYIDNSLRNWSQAKATISHWWLVNIGSRNGLVLLLGNKPLPELVLTKIYAIMWYH